MDRIREAIERHGQRFIDRIFTAAEIAYVEGKANRFDGVAAKFAKELGVKNVALSLTHTAQQGMAFVVLES